MAKLVLQDVPSGFNSGPTISANNTLVEAAIENTLSRDGTSPNDMEVDLDMGGHRITNLAEPVNDADAVRRIDLQDLVPDLTSVPWTGVTGKPATVDDVATLVDPNADRILFWDDSAGELRYLTPGTGLTITDTTIDAAGGGGGGVVSPDSYPASPDAMDDEFEEVSLNARWTWRNQSTATAVLGNGYLTLTGLPISTAIHRVIEQPLTTGRFRAKMAIFNTSNALSGMGVWRTANDRSTTIGCQSTTGYLVTHWDNSAFSSNPLSPTSVFNCNFWHYYEMEIDATNTIFRISDTGNDGSFRTVGTIAHATFLDGAPDRIFLFVNQQNDGSPASYIVVDWFRKMA